MDLRSFFADIALPRYLYTDTEQPFLSDEVQRVRKRLISSSPFYLQNNTYAENSIESVKALLSKCDIKYIISYKKSGIKDYLQRETVPLGMDSYRL